MWWVVEYRKEESIDSSWLSSETRGRRRPIFSAPFSKRGTGGRREYTLRSEL